MTGITNTCMTCALCGSMIISSSPHAFADGILPNGQYICRKCQDEKSALYYAAYHNSLVAKNKEKDNG